MKNIVIILIISFSCNNLISQSENLIENFSLYPIKNRLNHWSYKGYGVKEKKIKKIKNNGFNLYVNKTKEVELELSKTGTGLRLKTCFLKKLEAGQRIKVSFSIKYTDTCAIKAIDFIHKSGDKEFKVFYFTKYTLDTMSNETWYDFNFQYVPKINEGVENYFILDYLNPFYNKGKLFLKNLEVTLVNEVQKENRIRNSSFEWYYYYPVGPSLLNSNSLQFWNDFEYDFEYLDNNLILNKKINSFSSLHASVISDYSPSFHKKINIYDGHFAALIPNDYIYDSVSVSNNEIRNTGYIEIELTETLLAGVKYELTFYIMSYSGCSKSDNYFGAKFSKDFYNPLNDVDLYSKDRPLPNADLLFFNEPIVNDTTWTEVKSTYTAYGGERFLCIGAFKNSEHISLQKENVSGKLNCAAYLIDDVCLIISSQN